MRARGVLLAGLVLPLGALAGCGGGGAGGGGTVASTPTPVAAAVTPTATPTPVAATNYDTAEYRRANAAAQAQAISAYSAGATGNGVLVGVVDSGVDTASPEFAGRISPLSTDIAGTRGLGDASGHGTAVAGVLLGARNDSGIHGVAFGATLLALRTDTPGSCSSIASGADNCSHSDNNIAAALDAAVGARARVVNISLGGTAPNPRLRSAIDRATAAGTIIVIAAGNQGVTDPVAAQNPDVLAQVANDPIARGLVIIAGAVDSGGVIADFSNRAGNGSASYLAALGVRVRSADNSGTAYLYSGTSFATPVIAGAVALIAQAFPNLTPAQIVALLYRTADDRGTAGVDTTYGNGELNLARAFSPVGATSLAATKVPVSMTGNAVLSGAMGDAGQGSLGAVVRDEFGRDFDVDLGGTVARTPVARTLASGLATGSRSLAAADGRATFAIAIDDRLGARRMLLTPGDAAGARVLAGAMAVRVSKDLQLGFAAGRGADGLAELQGRQQPAFLIADRSLDRAPRAAFALRRAFGGMGLRIAAESGDMRLWQRGEVGPATDGVRRYAYGQLSAGIDGRIGAVDWRVSATQLDEAATVLGSRFGAALGGSGAVSWFADAGLGVSQGGWRFDAAMRHGWTALGANGVRAGSMLHTRSLSASLAREGLWVAHDSLALRYVEPLRVTSGALALTWPGRDPQTLSLTPSGRERDWEAVYSRPLGPGWFSANFYLRRQPGHYARMPDDVGAAVRYAFDF